MPTMAIRKRAVASAPSAPAAPSSSRPSGTHIKGHPPSAAPPNIHPEDDTLSVANMLPAIAVTSLVSVGSYYSCASVEMAEDVVVATLRTFAQLSLLAALLSPLFKFVDNQTRTAAVAKGNVRERLRQRFAPVLVLAYVFLFMLPIASYEASSRSKLTLRPPDSPKSIVLLVIMVSLFVAVSTMGAVAIFAIVKPVPRHSPRHVIPLCGMLFNNALSGVSLALDVLYVELQSKQRETIELMISFGADSWSATRPSFRTALTSSLKPQINSMSVIGLVAIPGMMTGQVLGGASPTRAARYQIIIMCLILGANFISICLTSELLIWNAFDERGALRDDWIVENDSLRVSQLLSSFSRMRNARTQRDLDGTTNAESTKLVAIELSSYPTSISTNASDEATMLKVDIDGLFAKGKRRMTANFALSRGVIALKGPSGVGKSTLLKSIAELNSGLVTESPSSGSVTLFGRDRSMYRPAEWRREVLYLPQTGASALQGTPSSFISIIASSYHRKHAHHATLESLASQTTTYMKSWGFESPQSKLLQPWSKLSGGEGQRILLAIALATNPTVLLLDESTSALDLNTKLAVEKSIRKRAENGCVVLVTHDKEQIERLGATVVMSMGAVA